MGCAGAREKLEDQMMLMKLERMEIQMEKAKALQKLSEIEGHKIQRNHIPDYIDPKFARERQIYEDDEAIGDKKTDDIRRKGKDKEKDKKKPDKKDKNNKHDNKNDKKNKNQKISKDKKNKK
jgi:hypothetical protein